MAVTNQQIVEFLLANPGMSDADIVAAMEQYGISPTQMAETVGIPEGEIVARVAETVPEGSSITLGDTRIAPQYEVRGSGEDRQVVGIENIYVEKTTGDVNYKAPVGSDVQVLSPTGEFVNTIKTKEDKSFFGGLADAFKDPVVLAALGGAAAGGLLGTAGAASGAAGGATALTAAEAAGLGLTATEAASLGLSATEFAAAGGAAAAGAGGAGLLTPAATAPTGATLKAGASSLLPTNALTGTTLGTAAAGAGGASLLTPAATAAGTGLLTAAAKAAGSTIGNVVNAGLTTAGGLVQSQVSKEAAQAAQKKIDEETAAAKSAAAFRPVGMTTRFGSSQFAFDPKTGQLTSAGYTLSPEAKAAQDRFVKLAESGITQAEGAQKAFEPLQTGAQSLFTLGNKYLAQSPEQVASDYLKSQMALLQPGRELELANLQNKLQQQGRAGLSVAQGGSLGATTPELQALFNARAQQEAILAANAQREGQQNVLFGSGLLNTGAQTLGQYYGGQSAAYNPYTTAMNQVQALETAGQQPLTTGINLGNLVSTAGARAGELGLRGAGQSVALATGAAATNSPLATALTGLGSSGLLTTGIDNAVTAFSANQLDPSRPLGNRLYEPPPANLAPVSNITAPLPITYSGTSVYNS